jgi:hypothetical protein
LARAYDKESAALKGDRLNLRHTNYFGLGGKERRNFLHNPLNLIGTKLGVHGQGEDLFGNSLADGKASLWILKVAVCLLQM